MYKLQYFCPGGKLIITQKLLELHKKLRVRKQQYSKLDKFGAKRNALFWCKKEGKHYLLERGNGNNSKNIQIVAKKNLIEKN